MATIDKEYHEILNKISENHTLKSDRTGTGTASIFEHTLRYDMSKGFPLLTTKKMFTKGVITELLWFLNGSSDLRELVNQGNNIWVGDAYKRYYNKASKIKEMYENGDLLGTQPHIEVMFKNELDIFTKEEFIDRIINSDLFNKEWGDLGPIYGKQWVSWRTFTHDTYGGTFSQEWSPSKPINQIQQVIDTLKTNPDSRRIMVSAWNPADIPDMILPPCHWAFEFYTEELTLEEKIQWVTVNCDIELENLAITEEAMSDKTPQRRLSLKWHQRSVDVPLGLPFNIASYAFLLEMVAQQVNMVPHMLVGDLTNVHIYKNQFQGVLKQLENDVNKYEAPRLKLNKADDIFSYKLEDFEIIGYESYPKIEFPLSN